MRWECERCGAMRGEKCYADAQRAARYANALNREDRDAFGRRPLLSLLPLKLIFRGRRAV